MQKQKIDIGIDLGTTFSSIAVYNQQNNQCEILLDPKNKESVPSWVSFSEMKEGDVKVGYSAKEDPKMEYVVYDTKRIIGRQYKEIDKKSLEQWKFKVINFGESTFLKTHIELQEKRESFQPEEISAIILSYMLNIFKLRRPNYEIGEVVVTVPAEFTNSQRKATETACKMAGIENVTLLNEPTAAFLDYQRQLREDGKEELLEGSRILVVDFGGGTLDINCCEYSQNEVNVIRNGGCQDLGGNDFDYVLQDLIKQKLDEELGIDDYYELPRKGKVTPGMKKKIAARKGRLRKEAEKAKIHLSERVTYEIDLQYIFEGETDEEYKEIIGESIEIKRSEFEEAAKPLIDKFKTKVKECAGKARFTRNTVDLVLLVGGTSKMPIIKRTLESLFSKEIFPQDNFDPMTAVAKGACFYAHNFTGNLPTELKVYDTIPFNIGLKVQQNKFLPIIEEGSKPLPVKRTTTASTESIGQEIVNFELYCGDKLFVDSEGMKKVGSFTIRNLPKTDAKISFQIEIEVQENGMLSIRAQSTTTDEEIIGELPSLPLDLRPIDRNYLRILKHFKNFLPPPLSIISTSL